MKDVFKNMRGAGLVGLLLMAVVFAVSVMLAGGLYFAKISRDMELNELNDERSPLTARLRRLWQASRRAASRRKSFLRLLLFTTCPRMCAVF